MANTYTQIYIHIVVVVKGRQNLKHKKWRDNLYKYICGIANAKEHKIFAIGGVEDHMHILVSMKPHKALSDLVRDMKANSARWINENKLVIGKFQWQEGYAAFSYAQSQLNTVIAYINNQEKHHAKKRFREEYIELLDKYQVDYDERYFFDWVDEE